MGNLFGMPAGWRQTWLRHSWGEGFDICPNGDILDDRAGSVIRYSYVNPSVPIASGVFSNFIFEWSKKDDTVYFVDSVTGMVKKLVPSAY